MPMGSAGMAEMGEMEMPLPDNTLPMMTGFGQFGPIEMGGMFSVVKVREGLARDDYKDPGPYKNPEGTVAYEVASAQPARRTRRIDKAPRSPASSSKSSSPAARAAAMAGTIDQHASNEETEDETHESFSRCGALHDARRNSARPSLAPAMRATSMKRFRQVEPGNPEEACAHRRDHHEGRRRQKMLFEPDASR